MDEDYIPEELILGPKPGTFIDPRKRGVDSSTGDVLPLGSATLSDGEGRSVAPAFVDPRKPVFVDPRKNPEDTQEMTALGVAGQYAKATNEGAAEFLDLLYSVPRTAIRMGTGKELSFKDGLQALQEMLTGDPRNNFMPAGLTREAVDAAGMVTSIAPGLVPIQRAATGANMLNDILGLGMTVDTPAAKLAQKTGQALADDVKLWKDKLTSDDEIYAMARNIAKREVIEKNRPLMEQYEADYAKMLDDNPKAKKALEEGADPSTVTLASDIEYPVAQTDFSLMNVIKTLRDTYQVDPQQAIAAIRKNGGIYFDDDPLAMAAADRQFDASARSSAKKDIGYVDWLTAPMSDVLRKRVSPEVGGMWERAVETSTRNYSKFVDEIAEPIRAVADFVERDRVSKAALLDMHRQPERMARILQYRILRNVGKEGVEAFRRFIQQSEDMGVEAKKVLYKPGEGFDDLVYIHAQRRGEPRASQFAGKDTYVNRKKIEATMQRSRKSGFKMDKAELDQWENPIASHLKFLSEQDQMVQIAKNFRLRPTLGKGSTSLDLYKGVERKLLQDGFDPQRAAMARDVMHDAYMGSIRSPHPVVRGLMSLGYAGTLAQFKSASLNIHDVFVSMTNQGLMPTMKAVMSTTKGQFGKSLADMGIGDAYVGEFIKRYDSMVSDVSRAEKFARMSHKVSDVSMLASGFRYLDTIGKGVVLRSAVNQAYKAAKKGNLFKEFGDVMNQQELAAIRPWLKTGTKPKDMPPEIAKLVEELAFTKLGQQQLISISGRPLAYAQYPNARPAYALTGFAIKQLAMLRRNAFHKMRYGKGLKEKLEGAEYLAKYVMFAGLGYGILDEGRSYAFKKENFDADDVVDGVVDQMWAVISLNRLGDRYSREEFSEDPYTMLLTSLIPPSGLVGAAAHDIVEIKKFVEEGEYNSELAKKIPVLGDFWNYYWSDKARQTPREDRDGD